MKKKPGTLIIELKHDANPTPAQLDDEQSALFGTLPPDCQRQIESGVPMGVIDLKTGKTLAVFNRENVSGKISEGMALEMLYQIRKFYQDPENVKAFLESEYNHERSGEGADE